MDPTQKSQTILLLKQKISILSPQLRTAAKYIIDYPGDFGLDTIRVTSDKAGVSTYTLVQIAKKLGFSSYEELREPFRHALVSTTEAIAEPDWMKEHREASAVGTVYADASRNAMAIVKSSLERHSPEKLEKTVDTLLGARTVYLTAVRASYSIAYYLNYVGRMSLTSLQLIPRQMSSAIDELKDAGPEDVLIAITITPYSRETIEACKFAKERGMKLVLITDSDVVSADFEPEHVLSSSVISTHRFGCFAGMMALVEGLIAVLIERGGEEAQERIRSYENLRRDYNAYWIAQKKH